jgi:hypothetical protein
METAGVDFRVQNQKPTAREVPLQDRGRLGFDFEADTSRSQRLVPQPIKKSEEVIQCLRRRKVA